MIFLLLAIAVGFYIVERLWPAMRLPVVRAWWPRVIFVNVLQIGILLLAGISWDRWLSKASLFHLGAHLGDISSAILAYLLSCVIFYGWHRFRHESKWFWRLCHQLHHSPQRIELLTSFYKHPVEITLNSLLSATIVYLVLGCSVKAGAYYTLMTAIAEYFYHWNIRTPHWLGYVIQRPESHRVHHQYRHHTNNFADLPILDILFGTFLNPRRFDSTCGFDEWREDRFEDMLAFRDVHAKGVETLPPLQFLPTCIGCRKRWACAEAREGEKSA
jgi:sterol desaturase/sphingolipid hydroxylase (fatty acid hydroxylase superfamily)